MLDYRNHELIKFGGQSGMVTAVDTIKFKPDGNNTIVEYSADIVLRHIFFLATPFVKPSLQKLCDDAEIGMRAKAE